MRNRSVAFVVRDGKILVEKMCFRERSFYALPGGGIEPGETPEQAAIRELKEECGLDGTVIRKLAEVYNQGRTEHSFEVSVPDDQEPVLGCDPEEPAEAQVLREVRWIRLNELPEKDRVFMWRFGLLEITGYFEEVLSWGDEISYPGMADGSERQ
jgi:8-oxo-dGTP pyrophosphatase MutT (NUDIX family)